MGWVSSLEPGAPAWPPFLRQADEETEPCHKLVVLGAVVSLRASMVKVSPAVPSVAVASALTKTSMLPTVVLVVIDWLTTVARLPVVV